MKTLVDISPGEVIGSGVLPDSMNEETLVWSLLTNVVIEAQGIGRPLGAQFIDTVTEDITHIVQQTLSSGENMAFFSGDTGVWQWNGTTVSLINQPFTAGGKPLLESWGDWTVGTNNLDPVKVRKGVGTTYVNLTGTNFTYCLQLIRRNPYMMALGTSDGPTWVRWCSDDNIEEWAVLPENTAGDFAIRDIPGRIRGGCSLGDAILVYSDEAITIATYIGLPYIFSFNTTIHGVGIYGPKAVCEANRKNYGLGLQGAFVTDGYNYSLLGDDNFRKWLKKTLDATDRHQISVFHNEFTDSIEFRFPTKTDGWAALYWKLDKGKFTTGDLQCNAAIERDVFPTPLVAVGNALCTYTRDVSTWNGAAFESRMETRWMDCGAIDVNKFVDHVFLNGEIDNVDILVTLQDLQKVEWEGLRHSDAATQNWVLQEALKVKVALTANDYFHISRVRLFGEQGGYAL